MDELTDSAEPPPLLSNKIPLQLLIPKKPENKFFYSNGLSSYINKMYLRVIHDLDTCYNLWNIFSLNKSIFHLWDFRLSWYQGFGYKPFFYTLYLGEEPLALLPLWYNQKEKRYEWFGGTWPEDNYFFVKDEKFIYFLLKIAPSPINLNAIDASKKFDNEVLKQFTDDEPKYVLDLKKNNTLDDYLKNINKKHRYNLKYFYSFFNRYSPLFKIYDGDQSHLLPKLVELSIIDFERNDISEYRKPERVKTFKMIYKNQGRYQIKTFLVYIQNLLVGYDIIGVYKNNFYILTGASDLQRFPGINTFMTYLEIEYAIKNKFDFIDCMQIDYNWKHKYFFQKPMLKFEK